MLIDRGKAPAGSRLASSSPLVGGGLGRCRPTPPQPTRVEFRCLFSVAGYALNGRRKRMLPANLESQFFLRENAHLSRLGEVHRILQRQIFNIPYTE